MAETLQSGHQRKVDTLMSHMDSIRNFIYFRINRQLHDSMDLCQETFIRAIQHSSVPTNDGECFAWLCGIAKNVMLEYYRQTGKDLEVRKHFSSGQIQLDTDVVAAGFETDVVQDYTAAVFSALAPMHKDVLNRKYIKGQDVRSIAKAMGRSETGVQSLLARARESFKQHWTMLAKPDES